MNVCKINEHDFEEAKTAQHPFFDVYTTVIICKKCHNAVIITHREEKTPLLDRNLLSEWQEETEAKWGKEVNHGD